MRTLASAYVLGLILWTLIEYLLHRFIFHRFRGFVGSFHMEHHVTPGNLKYLFVRRPYAIGVSVLAIAVIGFITGSFLQTAGLIGGIWTGYLYYESVHYRIHFTSGEGWLIARQRRAHFRHHFHDAKRCFGVTTPVWDYVFRTTSSSGVR
jgi:sterol desaturase/sphingolipid hydroxylase (fatty acid hydroxylase superfamily)